MAITAPSPFFHVLLKSFQQVNCLRNLLVSHLPHSASVNLVTTCRLTDRQTTRHLPGYAPVNDDDFEVWIIILVQEMQETISTIKLVRFSLKLLWLKHLTGGHLQNPLHHQAVQTRMYANYVNINVVCGAAHRYLIFLSLFVSARRVQYRMRLISPPHYDTNTIPTALSLAWAFPSSSLLGSHHKLQLVRTVCCSGCRCAFLPSSLEARDNHKASYSGPLLSL